MNLTVQSLLRMAREENRLSHMGPGEPFASSFHDMIEEFRHLLPVGVRLEARLEVADEEVASPAASMLIVALTNLVRNAIEHTEQGEISVAVSSAEAIVADTGRGIEAESVRRINASWQTAPEIGLGLAIVHRICRRFGWRCEIESAPGQGTTTRILRSDRGPLFGKNEPPGSGRAPLTATS